MKLAKLDVNETYRATGDLPALTPGEDPIWYLEDADLKEHIQRCTADCQLMVYPAKDNELGNIQPSSHNIREILARGAWFRGMFRMNMRGPVLEICRPVPKRDPEPFKKPEPLADHQAFDIATVLEWICDRKLARDDVKAAISSVAYENRYDPVADWLRGLQWDGVPRLDGWLHRVYGAEDSEFTRAVGAKWMISAVARALDPGCQVDTCLVLFGGQGVGKSSGLRELSMGWFIDDMGDMHSKDSIMAAARGWIVELAELAAAVKSEQETIKRFLTSRADNIRLPYAASITPFPRRYVFAATTNDPSFLKDVTGSRRFWCVDVSKPAMDAEGIVAMLRNAATHMWAEAVHRYMDGEAWHLTGEAAKQAQDAADGFQAELQWEDEVYTALKEHPDGIQASQIWTEYLAKNDKAPADFDAKAMRELMPTLKALGEKRRPPRSASGPASRAPRWFLRQP